MRLDPHSWKKVLDDELKVLYLRQQEITKLGSSDRHPDFATVFQVFITGPVADDSEK